MDEIDWDALLLELPALVAEDARALASRLRHPSAQESPETFTRLMN